MAGANSQKRPSRAAPGRFLDEHTLGAIASDTTAPSGIVRSHLTSETSLGVGGRHQPPGELVSGGTPGGLSDAAFTAALPIILTTQSTTAAGISLVAYSPNIWDGSENGAGQFDVRPARVGPASQTSAVARGFLRIFLAGLKGRSGRYLLELNVGCVDLTISGSAAGSERITRPDDPPPAVVPLLLDGSVS